MSKEAIRLALEALEMSHELDDTGYADAKKYGLASDEDITAKLCTAITALREALAEQPCDMGQMCLNCQPRGPNGECPDKQPVQQEPAGSVYRYGKDSSGKQWHGIRWTASGLDLPDGTLIYTSPPQQEPVAYDKTEINCFAQDLYDQKMREGKRGHYESMFHVIHQCIKKVSPPAQRKPLTEDWIRSRCGQTWVFEAAKQWVRLTEAAHNIKENT